MHFKISWEEKREEKRSWAPLATNTNWQFNIHYESSAQKQLNHQSSSLGLTAFFVFPPCVLGWLDVTNVTFWTDTRSTATFFCVSYAILCKCKNCVSKMSIVIDIGLQVDIQWKWKCQWCVVCQMSGVLVLLTYIKSTSSAKLSKSMRTTTT
jgi:hypothetical protein